MTQTVEAIYENGILRPVQPLEGIRDQSRVRVTVDVEPAASAAIAEGAKPIWEMAQDLMEDVPEEVRARLPSDGAVQHDHYIYGSPKRP